MKHKYLLVFFCCLFFGIWAQAQASLSELMQDGAYRAAPPIRAQPELEQRPVQSKETMNPHQLTLSKEVPGSVEFSFHRPTFEFEICAGSVFAVEDF